MLRDKRLSQNPAWRIHGDIYDVCGESNAAFHQRAGRLLQSGFINIGRELEQIRPLPTAAQARAEPEPAPVTTALHHRAKMTSLVIDAQCVCFGARNIPRRFVRS